MSTRRKILLLFAGLVLGLGVPILLSHEWEPTCHGRPLSHWVDRVGVAHWNGEPDPAAPEALRQIGAKAIPYLLKWMDYEPRAWREKLKDFCRQHQALKWLATREAKRDRRAWFAGLAFKFAGPEGKKSIPTIVRLLDEARSFNGRGGAACAVGGLGREELPALVGLLTNRDPHTRMLCVRAMQCVETNIVGEVLPTLIQCLSDTDFRARVEAARVLGALKLEPVSVVPALSKALQDPHGSVRCQAAWSLGGFGKEALPAVPSLQRATNDAVEDVRMATLGALHSIAAEVRTYAPPEPP
jgi:HEAT repeat protein